MTGSGAYAERPTITYSPLTGAKFTRSMMTPIPPAALFSLMQANWPAPFLFRLCVKAINGIYNRASSQLVAHAADPDFYALLEAMQLYASGTADERGSTHRDHSDRVGP